MDATVAAASVAAVTSVAAYLNAKYHIAQDIDAIRSRSKAQKYYSQLVKNRRECPWYGFAPQVSKTPQQPMHLDPRKSYTWQQIHDRSVQWANFFLDQGVKSGDLVATCLMNSADFMAIWLGLFCIGCAPAHLNYI
ncbi:Long-chain fatty acid transport protein 1 [Pyrenophora tritici-repentis]|nr:Long-chain fatty acid transport protein 1 [Pyrenophora tritici-repentis]